MSIKKVISKKQILCDLFKAFLHHPLEVGLMTLYGFVHRNRPSAEEQQFIDNCHQEEKKELQELGQGFKILVEKIPSNLRDLHPWFSYCTPVDEEMKQLLLECPDAIAARPYADTFAVYGLTPSLLFQAAHGVAMLASRWLHHSVLPTDQPISICPETIVSIDGKSSFSPRETAIGVIQITIEDDAPTAEAVFVWLTEVAKIEPLIFPGYQATITPHGLMLTKIKTENKYIAWGLKK